MMSDPQYSKRADSEAFNTVNKAFIRQKWIEYSKERLRKNERDYLRLFTLPGVDCRDVRLFLENNLLKVGKTGFIDDTLTFCERNGERYTRIKNALPGAHSFKGNYQSFMGKRSIGFSPQAENFFPFDVINLDFTGPGFIHEEYKTSSVMYSIKKTFEAQKLKTQSFTLFLTLTAEKDLDTEEGINELKNCISENNQKFESFNKAFKRKFPKGEFKSYQEFIFTGVSKVVTKWGAENNFDVETQESLSYIGGGEKKNRMIVFIFDCEYIGLPNGYGGTLKPINEIYLERIISALDQNLIDIDSLLEKDKKFKKMLVIETEKEPYRFNPN